MYTALVICIPTRDRCHVSHSENPQGLAPSALCAARDLDEPRPTRLQHDKQADAVQRGIHGIVRSVSDAASYV